MHKLVESLYNSKMAKHKSPSGSLSPLMMKYLYSSSSSNSNSSSTSCCPSPLSIMSNTNSPLSTVNEEDVLVIDGIPVRDGVSDDAGFSRPWEDFGNGRVAAKSQFAHGNDLELHSTHFPIVKNKSEICKSYITGSCTYGSKSHFVQGDQFVANLAKLVLTTHMNSPTKQDHEMKGSPVNTPTAFNSDIISNTSSISITSKKYWSPEDDGIDVTLPAKPGEPASREEVDEYIDSVLYGPTAARRRSPPFPEIC